jgi:sporulation protein YlmC with PRC-barrel domain
MERLYKDNFTGKNEGEPYANTPFRLLSATSIIGDKVLNDLDEDMGKIHDIMLDVKSGSIRYYVIEFGGFLGIGEKWFAIPFHLLTVDPEKKAFRFHEKRETLEKAPGFEKQHWPETNEHRESYENDSWSFWENSG